MAMFENLAASEHAFRATAVLVCVGGLISSLEFLAIWKEFRTDGVFAWRIMSSRPDVLSRAWVARSTELALSFAGSISLLLLRVAAFVLIPLTLDMTSTTRTLLVFCLASCLVLSYRNPFGGDGSDQMTIVVLSGLVVYSFAADDIMGYAGLVFVGAQGILSYVVSGVAKLISPVWRSGRALQGILDTRTYGHAGAAGLLARSPRWVNVGACWFVIVFESAFVLAPVLPVVGLVVLLAIGATFHLANAYVMGLNVFFWAFVSTYPCIVFVNYLVVAR
jgi:hypothetical protein